MEHAELSEKSGSGHLLDPLKQNPLKLGGDRTLSPKDPLTDRHPFAHAPQTPSHESHWANEDPRPLDTRAPGEALTLQRSANGTSTPDDSDAISSAATHGTSGPGQQVPFRGEMESLFSTDFSSVRAHMDAPASDANRALGAQAYAMGEDIAFSHPSPEKALVAHELTHIVQQRSGGVSSAQGKGGILNADPALEAEADLAADKVMRGEKVSVTGIAGGGAQRKIQLNKTRTDLAKEKNAKELKGTDVVDVQAELDKATDFEKLAELLTGNPIYRSGEPLNRATVAVLALCPNAKDATGSGKSYWQGRYLWELLNTATNYEPTVLTRVVMGLGLITHGTFAHFMTRPGDPEEVRLLLESGQVTRKDAETMRTNADIQTAIGRLERMSYRIEKLLNAIIGMEEARGEAQEKLTATGGGKTSELKKDALNNPTPEVKKFLESTDNFLAMLANRYSDKVGDANHEWKVQLFRDLSAWAEKASEAEREYVLTQGTLFKTQLPDTLKNSRDREYALSLIREAAPVDETNPLVISIRGAQDGQKVDSNAAPKAGGEGAKMSGESVQEVLQFITTMKREKAKADDNYFRTEHRYAVERLNAMSDQARDAFLKYWMAGGNLAGKQYEIDGKPPAEVHKLRIQALDEMRTELIKQYDFEDSAAEKFLSRLRTRGELGQTYKSLVDFLQDEPDFDDRLDGIAERLVAARAEDLTQVLADAWLLQKIIDNINTANQPTYKDKHKARVKKVVDILNLPATLLGADKEAEIAEHAETKADAAAESPTVWAAAINEEIDKTFTDHGIVAAQIHRAWMAATDLALKTPPIDEASQKTNRTNYMATMEAALSDGARKWLQGKMDPEIDGGLNWHGRLLAQTEVPSAEWRVAVSTRGIKDRSEEIEIMLDDLKGIHVFELSNFPAFKALWAPLNEALLEEPEEDAGPQRDAWNQRVEALYTPLDSFVFDLNPGIVEKIEKEHNRIITGNRTSRSYELIGMARKHLAEALAGDSSVQAEFMKLGMHVSDFLMLEKRLRALALLDAEALSNRGLQWDSINVKSVLRKEAVWRFKGAFKEKGDKVTKLTRDNALDKDEGARAASIKDSQDDAFEFAESVDEKEGDYERRKEAFEAMRSKYNARLMFIIGGILSVAFGVALTAVTAGVGSPFLVGIIAFAFSLAQKAISSTIEAAISGKGLDLSPDACWRLLIKTTIEAGIAVASSALSAHIKGLWDANVAGKDWSQVIAENKDWASLTQVKDVGGKDWHSDAGILHLKGLFAEAGKEAGLAFTKRVFQGVGDAATALLTEKHAMKAVKSSLQAMAQEMFISAGTTFTSTLATAKLDEALNKDQIAESERLKGERDENIDKFQGGEITRGELDASHQKFGNSLDALAKSKIKNSAVTGIVGFGAENVTEAAMRKIPGLGEDEDEEEAEVETKEYEEQLEVDGMLLEMNQLEDALEALGPVPTLLKQADAATLKTSARQMATQLRNRRHEMRPTADKAIANGFKGQPAKLLAAQKTAAGPLLEQARPMLAPLTAGLQAPAADATLATQLKPLQALKNAFRAASDAHYITVATLGHLAAFEQEVGAVEVLHDQYKASIATFSTNVDKLKDVSDLAAIKATADTWVGVIESDQNRIAESQKTIGEELKRLDSAADTALAGLKGITWHSYRPSKSLGKAPQRVALEMDIAKNLEALRTLLVSAKGKDADITGSVGESVKQLNALKAKYDKIHAPKRR